MYVNFLKNRSQGLAALISNWSEAKQALEDAYNSEGSALRENERIMQSIKGHTNTLTNDLQKLASISIESDWLKTMVDFLDLAVKGVTTLVDKFDSLSVILGGVFGTIASFNGVNILDIAGGVGPGSIATMIGGGIKSLANNRFAPLSKIPLLREKPIDFANQ